MIWLRPPGALPERTFRRACVHCGQCAAVCPQGSIRLAETWGAARHTPVLTPERSPCDLCMKCPPVCPTGALRPVKAEEAGMGTAVILRERCLNWTDSGIMCTTCYDRCPLRGKGMVLELGDMGFVPTVGAACVGCGMCVYVCPKNAVSVAPGRKPVPAGTDKEGAA